MNAVIEINELNEESFDFDELEKTLESEIEGQMSELGQLKDDFQKIGTPEAIGNTIADVVWEQFINQVGVVAGEDFIRENRGLKLDLRDDAHIQTAENFKEGKIATHNYISREQLEQNYDRYNNKPHGQFRKEYVNPGMDATLKRAGELNNNGIETVKDIYTGRQIPTQTKLEDGSNNPLAAQREHVKSSSELYQNPSLQMANGNEELAAIINDPENLQGYTTAERNNRKSDHTSDEMDDYDKNRHWEKANERAENFIKEKEKEGEDRLKAEGRKTQKEEAFRIGGKALRSAVMALLADLARNIIQKLIKWLRSAKKSLETFISSIKEAVHSFVDNLKKTLLTVGNSVGTTIATAIFGPIVNMIKKAWIFLKQGYHSIKDAIKYLTDPEHKQEPLSLKMLNVGKIIIGALTAGGAIVLGEAIEKGLMYIPIFAVQIPILGSLANILGIFFGAIIAGIIGALALHLIDKAIANTQKKENIKLQLDKGNEILIKQGQLVAVAEASAEDTKGRSVQNIANRHNAAEQAIRNAAQIVIDNSKSDNDVPVNGLHSEELDDLMGDINNI